MRRIADGKMELGLGIHGEPGAETAPLQPVGEIVSTVCSKGARVSYCTMSLLLLHLFLVQLVDNLICRFRPPLFVGEFAALGGAAVQHSAALAIALAIPCTN